VDLDYSVLDFGLLFCPADGLRLALTLKNAVGFAFEDGYSRFELPRDLTLALALCRERWTWSLDAEYLFGGFGGYDERSMDVVLVRTGMEYEAGGGWFLRGGLIHPARADLSEFEDFSIPLCGAFGVGMDLGRWRVDLAVFGDPVHSHIRQAPVIGATTTITVAF
jgi:hypothetical protein